MNVADITPGQSVPTLDVKIRARHVVMGASSSRDWQPQHHDSTWARERAGTGDIFLNTPNQAGWIERFLTDWTGPAGRLAKVRFRMKRSVFPGDVLSFTGEVTSVDHATGFVDLEVELKVGDELATGCTARVALPRTDDENPWKRAGDDWRP